MFNVDKSMLIALAIKKFQMILYNLWSVLNYDVREFREHVHCTDCTDIV